MLHESALGGALAFAACLAVGGIGALTELRFLEDDYVNPADACKALNASATYEVLGAFLLLFAMVIARIDAVLVLAQAMFCGYAWVQRRRGTALWEVHWIVQNHYRVARRREIVAKIAWYGGITFWMLLKGITLMAGAFFANSMPFYATMKRW